MAGEEFDEPDAGYMPKAEVDELDTGDMSKEEVHELDTGNIHGEEFNEHDAADMPEVSHPPQKQESRNDSGEGGGKRWPGWPGENIFRMLVPVQKVGSIIGRKGEFIKKITEETKARIKILDFPSGTERVVMVSAKEEPDAPVAPAIDGLLRVHKRLADVNSDPSHPLSAAGGVVITKLLVADAQAGSLIGKQGSTIKSIQDASNCNIRVLGAEHLPPFALQNDSLVEIHGEPASMHKAVELIASHLRKFLVDRSIVGVFEVQMQMPNAQSNQNMSSHQSWGPPPQAFPMSAAGGPGFVPNPQYMQPPHQFDNYHQPVDLLSLDKLPHQGSMYRRDPSIGVHASSAPPQQPIMTKVMHHMQIPLSYADAVIGPSGANISYIRRASGATIAIQETKGIPGEMTVEINGSASQIQTAEQLIQNSVAEAAASSTQNPTVSQGYNTYPAPGPVYPSPPSNTGHAGHAPAADYGPIYGSNYGY